MMTKGTTKLDEELYANCELVASPVSGRMVHLFEGTVYKEGGQFFACLAKDRDTGLVEWAVSKQCHEVRDHLLTVLADITGTKVFPADIPVVDLDLKTAHITDLEGFAELLKVIDRVARGYDAGYTK